MQKSCGPWTTYGGACAALDSAPGQRNYPFGGWLVQRNFGKHLTLGGEIFAQGSDTDSDNGFAALNFGGFYNVTEHFSILFTGGHTIAGDRSRIGSSSSKSSKHTTSSRRGATVVSR